VTGPRPLTGCPRRRNWRPGWVPGRCNRKSAGSPAAVLALAAAVLYGSADFLGGVGSRRASALSFLAISAPAGAVIMLVAAVAADGPVTAGRFGWGLAAGVASGAGVIVFFAGLAAGPISVVAPLSALGAALLPAGVALAEGEPLGAAVLAGAVLCLASVTLVSLEQRAAGPPGRRPAMSGVACGLAAGVAFGLYLLFIRDAAQAGGLWPLAVSRCTASAIVLTGAAWPGHRPVRHSGGRGLARMALAAGAGDVAASLLYVLAVRSGPFALAVVITALYPAVTVLLARLVLGERMRAVQRAGLALGALGIILVTA
jgi:drug/metabolite transporter (DMT)-like permease